MDDKQPECGILYCWGEHNNRLFMPICVGSDHVIQTKGLGNHWGWTARALISIFRNGKHVTRWQTIGRYLTQAEAEYAVETWQHKHTEDLPALELATRHIIDRENRDRYKEFLTTYKDSKHE